jgi:hypothetical protein
MDDLWISVARELVLMAMMHSLSQVESEFRGVAEEIALMTHDMRRTHVT